MQSENYFEVWGVIKGMLPDEVVDIVRHRQDNSPLIYDLAKLRFRQIVEENSAKQKQPFFEPPTKTEWKRATSRIDKETAWELGVTLFDDDGVSNPLITAFSGDRPIIDEVVGEENVVALLTETRTFYTLKKEGRLIELRGRNNKLSFNSWGEAATFIKGWEIVDDINGLLILPREKIEAVPAEDVGMIIEGQSRFRIKLNRRKRG